MLELGSVRKSRNYYNWEKLVAAVLKREQYRQLCHQDSVSTIHSDSSSIYSDFSPVALENSDGLKLVRKLGKGEFGATHLALLSQRVQQHSGLGSTAVIKRANTIHLTNNEFESQMMVLGNFRHENVGTPRAYYYSKTTQLIVYDYYTQGSVFDMLQRNDGKLNWESRVKIAVGAAHGITHIHAQSVFHGNIKSSNIFVTRQGYGCVCETGLAGMMMKKKSVGEKGDVYNFGLLLHELVTGKSPIEESLVDSLRCFEPSQGNLYRFHREKDERKRFPFVDEYIDISVPRVHQELLNMLQVAKRCLALSPEERPSMSEVVSMLLILNDRSQHQDGEGRSVFFECCNLAFDLNGLLTAFGKVVGEGTAHDATRIAVKRIFKSVIIGRRNDFKQWMEVVGKIRHENVVPLRAYYYYKDVKLVIDIHDFYNRGSVAALLHGKRGEKNMVSLDWETRLKISIGAARGIAHIHAQCGGKLVHGNIKSSNIFLNSQQHGCIFDLVLATLMSPLSPSVVWSGYRAPEITDATKVSQSSDVYSYGVFLLELLTGKSPVHAPGGGEEVVPLVRWVNSVVREVWTGELFDVELLRYPNVEEEMVTMLRIGRCVARMPEQRPKMEEVVKMVEEIRVGGTRSQGYSPDPTPRVNEIGSSSVQN